MTKTDFIPSRRRLAAAGAALAGAAATGLALDPTAARGGSPDMQATIRTGTPLITLVNLFTVEPARLPSLVALLREGTETFFSTMPGFVSSSVLAARDGRQAINYSQWRSAEDVAAFRRDPRFAPYIQRLLALARAEAVECDVAYVKSV